MALSSFNKFCFLLFGVFVLAVAHLVLQIGFLLTWVGVLTFVLSLYGWKTLTVFIKTFRRDFTFLIMIFQMIPVIRKFKQSCKTPGEIFSITAKKYPNKAAIVAADTGKKLTFEECDLLANKVAHYFLQLGFIFGDVVGIWMENELEYLPIALGLSKVGIVSAFINTKLNGDSLKHVLKAGKCKGLIYHVSFKERLVTMDDVKFIMADNSDYDSCNLFPDFENIPDNSPCVPDALTLDTPCFYVYTSGSTGYPKACSFSIFKCFQAYTYYATFLKGVDNICYNVIPIFHAGGILILPTFTLINGATMVIRRRFQPESFFKDCCDHGATICGFVGEMCRYLIKQPESEYDKSHKLTIIMGNGLRGPFIPFFKKRFKIATHIEYYGATDANAGFMNVGGKEGAVGFISMWLPRISFIVKVNVDTGEIIKDARGYAIECPHGAPGLLVNKITPYSLYDGYVDNEEASKKNVAENLFEDGDRYFVSGDIMRHDEEGWMYFVSRMSDNYKWGGENVSISQIENVISELYSFADVVSYPVRIPQGKVGMVFVNVPKNDFDIAILTKHIHAHLPSFSHPQFIRVGCKFNLTGTFKYAKNELKADGYNCAKLRESEKLYFYHNNMYEKLNEENYSKISSGEITFANER